LDAVKLTIGAIYGSGTNGVYLENISKISKFRGFTAKSQDDTMLINTEWGAFDSQVILQ
jgi:hexokinase